LSTDDERRALIEMEQSLRRSDPAFVARMRRPFPAVTVLLLLLYTTAPLIGLLFGMAAVGIVAAAMFGAVAAVVVRRRFHRARGG
jgi:hypothetical protein